MAINPKAFIKSVKLTDTGWKRIKREFRKLDKLFTAVGFFSDDVYPGSNIGVPGVAAVHEFGSRNGKIPERSFMRKYIDKNKTKINQFKLFLIKKVVDGKMNADQAIKSLGEFVQAGIKKEIILLSMPPLSLKTILSKKSTNPLIDKSIMLGSVTHKEYKNRSSVPK